MVRGRALVKRKQPERQEQRGVVQLLRSVGCQVWPIGTNRRKGDYQGTMMAGGLPDIVGCLPRGLGMLFVEVKAPNGKLSPDQAIFRDAVQSCAEPHAAHYVTGGLDAVIFLLIHLGLLHGQDVPFYRLPKQEQSQ